MTPEERRERHNEAARRHAERNRDKVRESKAQYRERNRAKIRAAGREYWQQADVQQRAKMRYEANRPERLAAMRARYERTRDRLKDLVFGHYGRECQCCGVAEDLCIDHMDGDGYAHRQELWGKQHITIEYYQWLVDNGYPGGFQTLCRSCNASKGTGDRCRMRHH